ncbi:hypothetical protein YC2023_016417 [Brassica napus]
MISWRWDPGICEFYEDWIWKSSFNLRWLGLGRWNLGRSRRFRIMVIRISISILIKTKSNLHRGIISVSFRIVNQGSRKENYDGTDEEIIWGIWAWRMRLCGEIDFDYKNSRRFGVWYKCDSSLQEYDRSDDIFMYWNMVS